jgi:Protein of unknown function (DUF1475)
MIPLLRALFLVILAGILAVVGWASAECSLWAIPPDVLKHPWFLATLLDAYFAFIAVYVWMAWKERGMAARVLWFPAVILLGNVAIAAFFLRELFAVPARGPLAGVFTERRQSSPALPGAIAAIGVAVYVGARFF